MKKLMFVLVLIFLLGSVSAQHIYGDIYITEEGKAIFSVETDVDLELSGLSLEGSKLRGVTNELISMERGIWSFMLNLGFYETILLDIHLPDNIEKINLIEGVDYFIGFDQKTLSIIEGDEDLYFYMEYEISSEKNYGFLYFLGFLIALFLLVVLFIRFSNRKERKLKEIFPFINDKEEKIIKLLMKKSMRQKEVRKKLNIPKASYSRYLVNLEKKKLVSREGEGKNKILKLK